MKTLVVLSALAAVALAAPTLHEQGSEDFKKFTNVPETIKRERKSTQEPSTLDPSTGAPSTSHITEFGVSGRSFGLIKKPIIIKKKPLGYQVYRDSDEVPIESGETCGSQVKVKFCDGKTKLKGSTIEDADTQITEDDMKHSITLAKEAIENLQKDLNTVERKPGTQGSSWNHGHSESDSELHQDIENAREALEHIHKNFENFESMSLHKATTKDDMSVVPETHFTIAKSEEQRLAQWKEAIDTIQKNVEIAKNIEDSFRMAPDVETGSIVADGMMLENSKQESDKKIDHNLRTSEDKHEHKIETESCKVDHANEKSSEHKNAEDDMQSSASTISEKKVKEDETKEKSELLTDTKIDQFPINEKSLEGAVKEKEADVVTMTLKDLSEKNAVPDTMNLVKNDGSENDKKIAVEESVDKMDASINTMKAVEAEDMLIENQQKAAVSNDDLEKLETNKHREMKSAELLHTQSNKNKKEENVEANLHTEPSKQIDTPFSARSAEEGFTNPQEESLVDETKKSMAEQPEKHMTEAKMAKNIDWKTKQATLTSVNDIEHMEMKEHQNFHPEMRSEDLKNMHQQLMMNPQTRWADNKNMKNVQQQREVITSASDFHHHVMQHPNHHHHFKHGLDSQHFEVSSGDRFHSDFPEHFFRQGKSSDQDMQAYYMKMRDASGLAPENHRFRWKPMHEGSRSAYGAPAPIPVAGPPAGSAVGVFPNAHIGNCGIPLLLSCNPSVVPGSLAKPAAPYSPAPAYRSEDDFNFHKKRDVKKTHEILSSPMRGTSKANMKTSTVLAAKQ